jgi:hypothetical protein
MVSDLECGSTGVQSGDHTHHRDGADEAIFARRWPRRRSTHGRNDALSAVPAGLSVVGGPRITHGWLETSSSVVLTSSMTRARI